MKLKTNQIWGVLLSVFMLISLCSCEMLGEFIDYDMSLNEDSEENSPAAASAVISDSEKKFVSHYLDIGQGDSEFLEFPNGKTMLIDAGPTDAGSKIVDYIKNLGYTKIDYVIGTHPHADHIGGMRTVINAFDIGTVYMPKVSTNTKTYEKLLTAIQDKGLKIKTAKAGVKIINEDNLSVNMIAPVQETYQENNLNLYSAVIMVQYGDKKFLYMGDAEAENESEITADVSADVIKVGHHGSNTSSSQEFVDRVKPSLAIFSLAADNSYHHPHAQPVKRWQKIGATLLRTDESGTIIVTSDGKEYTYTTEKTKE